MTPVAALLLCMIIALLSAAMVWGMTFIGAVDVPGARSSHTQPTPKGGGVGIAAASLGGMLAVAIPVSSAYPYFWPAMLAAAGIAAFGYWDDSANWPSSWKFAAQLGVSLLTVCAGLSLHEVRLPAIGAIHLGWFGPVVTLLWLVVTMNAVNFIDGLNGLLGGVTAITCAAMTAIGCYAGIDPIQLTALVLLGGAAGFLPFNYPWARIFMGDAGSQFCGYVLALLAILAGEAGGDRVSVWMVPIMLAGVFFDVAYTLLRRFLSGDRLVNAHRSHLYQMAQQAGMPAYQVTLVHCGFAAWGALLCGLFVSASPGWRLVWVAAVVPPQILWLALVRGRTNVSGIPGPGLRWRRRINAAG